MGLAYGWLSPILNQLRDSHQSFHITEEECSWIASLHNIGRAFGPLAAGLLVDVIGRKFLLISCSLTFFLMWLVVLFTRNVWALYAVRTIVGLAIGLHDSISFLYIAENSSAHIRGTFISVAVAFFYLGELAAFVLATYLSYDQVATINASTVFVFLMFAFLLREPAQFLLMKNKYKSAEKNFYWLNERKEQSKIQFDEIIANIQQEKEKVSWKQLLTSKANFLSLRVVLTLSILEMFTGFEAITAFVSMAFTSSDSLSEYEFTILFGFFQFVTVCMSSFVIDRFNRRTLFLVSFAAASTVHAITAALFYINQAVAPIPCFPWFIFVTITMYSIIYSVGIMPIYLTLRGELFPQSIKAMGNCAAVVVNAIAGFVTTKMFLTISIQFGMHFNFLGFSIIGWITFVYVFFSVPETKGKTLVEIQRSLES